MSEFLPIPGFYPYKASADGRISNLNGKILSPKDDRYLRVCLSINKKETTQLVHRLIALSFIPNPNNLPAINHKNGIKHDNRVENLEWITHSDNHKHAYATGLKSAKGEKNGQAKLTDEEVLEIKNLLNTTNLTTIEIGKMFNISRQTISLIRTNKRHASSNNK
jgi:hypothetical protein